MTAELLEMQAPLGIPRSTLFEVITDPLLPPQTIGEMVAHFPPQVYDLDSSSHIMRLLKVLLGDAGTGQLRKRYTYAHLSHFLLTVHFNDLDQLYADVFGLKRLIRERLSIDPYNDATTDEEWEAIMAADASYRARVEAFSRAISMAGTPSGMVLAACAVLGTECRVYESYAFLDDAEAYSGAVDATDNDYGDLEVFTYGELNGRTYAELEGTPGYMGRLPDSRGEFIIRPLRTITAEEQRALTIALNRLKPAEALLTIDSRPGSMSRPVSVSGAAATSTYWHIQRRVLVPADKADLYARYEEGVPTEQPKHAFSAYQGEEWDYNADAVSVSSYVEDEDGNVVQSENYERWVDARGQVFDYTPDLGLAHPAKVLLGRSVSDGVMAAPVAVREVV